MGNNKKNTTPKFQEFLFNELVKVLGSNFAKVPLMTRLEKSYEIIKSQKSIYEKFQEKDFFMSFLKTTQFLVVPSDKKSMEDLIHVSYLAICDKENVLDTYQAIFRELKLNNKDKKGMRI